MHSLSRNQCQIWQIKTSTRWHFAHFSKCIFFTENVSTKISLKFVPKGPIDHKSELVQLLAWLQQAPSHYLSQWQSTSMTHICGNRTHCVGDFTLRENTSIKCGEKRYCNSTRDACFHPLSKTWAIPTCRVGTVLRTGWPYFVKYPLARDTTPTPIPPTHLTQCKSLQWVAIDKGTFKNGFCSCKRTYIFWKKIRLFSAVEICINRFCMLTIFRVNVIILCHRNETATKCTKYLL